MCLARTGDAEACRGATSDAADATQDAIVPTCGLTIRPLTDGRDTVAETGEVTMATMLMTKGATATDRIVAWALLSGLAIAVLQYAEASALPAHFV